MLIKYCTIMYFEVVSSHALKALFVLLSRWALWHMYTEALHLSHLHTKGVFVRVCAVNVHLHVRKLDFRLSSKISGSQRDFVLVF